MQQLQALGEGIASHYKEREASRREKQPI